jgi:pyruvate,orthophosphate dikinase
MSAPLRAAPTVADQADPPGSAVRTEALLAEGRLDRVEALRHVTPAHFAAATRPAADIAPEAVVGRGLGVAPGAATGLATFDAALAAARAARGEPVVLIRSETGPEDLTALMTAAAFVITRGGRTSHAALVARSSGRPCVVGLAEATIDRRRDVLEIGHTAIADGDLVTVDGTHGVLARGEHAYLRSGQQPEAALPNLLAAADAYRRMDVWANADTAADAAAARQAGATGVGLCRTEHMFLGDRRRQLTDVLCGPYDSTAQESLAELHRLQRADFHAILTVMDGLPVVVRLLDPPRHEFLPGRTELAVEVAVAAANGHPALDAERRWRAVERMWEHNPMLGVRGIRLGILLPWLHEMQIAALLEATAAAFRAGGRPRPQLLVPMIATGAELRPVLACTEHLLSELRPLADHDLILPVGAMIETPRAALTAAEVAKFADFLSFGTNDLTQLTWGLSRDDTTAMLRRYQDLRLVEASPFERLDQGGVGQLIRVALAAARRVRPGLRTGVCGEHASDPESIQAFHDWGVDYLSCSKQDVPLARYVAGYAGRARSGALIPDGAD